MEFVPAATRAAAVQADTIEIVLTLSKCHRATKNWKTAKAAPQEAAPRCT